MMTTLKVRNHIFQMSLVQMDSEDLMKDWVNILITEIGRIETFYTRMCEEYRNEFNILNRRFHSKFNPHSQIIVGPDGRPSMNGINDRFD